VLAAAIPSKCFVALNLPRLGASRTGLKERLGWKGIHPHFVLSIYADDLKWLGLLVIEERGCEGAMIAESTRVDVAPVFSDERLSIREARVRRNGVTMNYIFRKSFGKFKKPIAYPHFIVVRLASKWPSGLDSSVNENS
jgi:hypothetical protein